MMQNKTAFPKFGNAVLLLGVCGIIKNKDFKKFYATQIFINKIKKLLKKGDI